MCVSVFGGKKNVSIKRRMEMGKDEKPGGDVCS